MAAGEEAKVNLQELSNHGNVLHIKAEENWETGSVDPVLKTTGHMSPSSIC